jgi:hypothetical protein
MKEKDKREERELKTKEKKKIEGREWDNNIKMFVSLFYFVF